MAALRSKLLFLLTLTLLALNYDIANANIRGKTQRKIKRANSHGPFIGILTRSQYELNLLLEHPRFTPYNNTVDVAGKTFRFGNIYGERVILAVTGSSLINAGIAAQLLVSLFRIKGVVHYGVAGTADPSLHIGDVIIPQQWAHTGLWSWQRFGNGPENELPLEGAGDYTREIGYLRFADYAVNIINDESSGRNLDNVLNYIWYQPEEIFPVNGTLEERQHIFWVPVDSQYYDVAEALEEDPDLELENCVNATTCVPTAPKVTRVSGGASASIYVDNAAYGNFLKNKFNVGPVDMDSAAVALICHQQQVPFITIKSLSDVAGRRYTGSADTFTLLAAKNSVTATVNFIKMLWLYDLFYPHVHSM